MTEENRAILDLENVRHMIDTHSSGHLAIDNAQVEITRLTEALGEAKERLQIDALVEIDVEERNRKLEDALTAAQATIGALREALGRLCDEIEDNEQHGSNAYEESCSICRAVVAARAALASPAEKEG